MGLRQWWRRHDPPLPTPGSNSTPIVHLAGLTGISLDIQHGLDLASLTDAEAERAVRYALYEFNGFPIWFDELVAVRPMLVKTILEPVVRQEWASTVQGRDEVIARASYESARVAKLVHDIIVEELTRKAPGNARTLRHAINLMQVARPGDREVASILERYTSDAANGGSEIELLEWLRGWTHFAPEKAAIWLGRVAKSNQDQALQTVDELARSLERDFSERGTPVAAAIWRPSALEAWSKLLILVVRPEDDLDRTDDGIFTPGERDIAQSFRNRCLSMLARDPSHQAHQALKRLRNSRVMQPYAEMMRGLVEAQLSAAAEHLATPWTETDILEVERGDERKPRTTAELYALVQRHLVRVAELVENDDFSYAVLFPENADEKEIQCWVASSLRLVSDGLYTVEREPEAQNDKLMDLSITIPGVARVPIEIKPLYKHRYSYAQLEAFVSDQLVGRYMKPAAVDSGILLLVPLVTRNWHVNGRVLTFAQMRAKLSAHAKRVGARAYKNVSVMSINIGAACESKLVTSKRATRRRRRASGRAR